MKMMGVMSQDILFFSPDHNKFITGVEINKYEDDSSY